MPGRSPRRNWVAGLRPASPPLRRRQLTGILNGIDESWDPEVCAQLAQPFGAGDWEGKRANRITSASSLVWRCPAVRFSALSPGWSTRRASTSCLSAADEIIEAGGQIIVTGSGEPEIEQALVDAHRRRPDAIGVTIGFNDGQARRIFAGSDFTLMPSRFEPCGLSQMYAQTIRIAADRSPDRRIGGNHHGRRNRIPVHRSRRPNPFSAASGAPSTTFMAKDRLNSMRRSAMARSFSWDTSGGLLQRAVPQDRSALKRRLNTLRFRPPRFRHHEPDHRKTERGDARKPE